MLLVTFSVCSYPDKICDQISDAVLDAHLKQDPNAKVACGKRQVPFFFFFAGDLSMLDKEVHGAHRS